MIDDRVLMMAAERKAPGRFCVVTFRNVEPRFDKRLLCAIFHLSGRTGDLAIWEKNAVSRKESLSQTMAASEILLVVSSFLVCVTRSCHFAVHFWAARVERPNGVMYVSSS